MATVPYFTDAALPARRAAAAPVADVVDASTAATWSWGFVGLGIAIRLFRYLCVYPIWQDEQLLALNLIERDYAGLLDPLDMHQVAPLGFLMLVKWMVATFGLNELSLRAVSLVGSIVGLVAFRALAARLLSGTALVMAVGIMAISFFPVRHAAEFKPYAVDLGCATLLLLAAVDWFREPQRLRNSLVLTVVAALSLPLSFPSVFVVGGIALTMLPVVVRERSKPLVRSFVVFNAIAAAMFLALYLLNVGRQFDSATSTSFMYDYWTGGFPPALSKPWEWPLWFIDVHTGEGLAYPFGSKRFGSSLSTLVAVVGLVTLWRRGDKLIPKLTMAILGLAIVAACLGRYPYGHGERLQQYWAPLVCLAMGAGASALLDRCRSAVVRRRLFVGFATMFVFVGTALAVQAHLRPFKHRWDREHQLFSRWFWKFASDGVPQLCITDDLGWRLYSKDSQKSYAVQREIYRHGTSAQARHNWHSLPAGTPIDCVTFALEARPRDEAQFAAWMTTMQRHYRLVGERMYPIMIDDKPGKTAAYYVWRFEPRTPSVRPDCVVRSATSDKVRLDGTPADPLDPMPTLDAKRASNGAVR